MFQEALKQFAPRPRLRSFEWCRESIYTPEGRPYDHAAYPHLGAPGGPFDALDDDLVREIWLQFGSRLGKSFFGNCALLFTASQRPCPLMLASSTETTALDVTARLYGMYERCRPLKSQLRPERLRRQDRIDFDNCRAFVAWSRSVSTLADKAVRVGQANEVDKWEHKGFASGTATEADPLKLFDNRFKEYPTHKKIKESTPTVKRRSRIEAGRLQSTNCRLSVPCPHCETYQTLEFANLKWQKLEGGKHDKELARTTAYYECAHCQRKIQSHHRPAMIRKGVWCPEGSTVNSGRAAKLFGEGARLIEDYQWNGWNKASWIDNKPLRDGTDAGYQLSSLYAIQLEWGDIAAEWVSVMGRAQDLRDFINQWLGETWEIAEKQQTWQQLGLKLLSNESQGPIKQFVVPATHGLVTCGIDKQKDHYAYVVDSWGPARKSHTVTYGEADSLEWILQNVIGRTYECAGHAKKTLAVALALVDSRYRPRDVYEALRTYRGRTPIYASMGSIKPLGVPYRRKVLGKDTANPGRKVIHVDTVSTQDWIDNQLHNVAAGEEGSATLFAGSLYEHQDFLEQLLNDAPLSSLDSQNYEKETWNRIDENIPNDFRDCRRYGYVAMLLVTRGRPIVAAEQGTGGEGNTGRGTKKPRPKPQPLLDRPGGWATDFRK